MPPARHATLRGWLRHWSRVALGWARLADEHIGGSSQLAGGAQTPQEGAADDDDDGEWASHQVDDE
eukprot:2426786-Prymnesium_polylepis.1